MEYVRKLDELGRIVLPAEMRNELGWDGDSRIAISLQDDQLVLRTSRRHCVICGNEERLRPVRGKMVCQTCIDELKSIF